MKRIFAAIMCVAIVLTMSTVTAFASSKDNSILKLPEDDGTGYPVTGISGDSYKNNDDVTKLVVPENITRLGERVFIGCSNLEQIKLHDKIQVIGESAFERTAYYDDKDNWEDGVLYIGDALIKADSKKIGEAYSIRKGTRIIADGAFADCQKLNSITIPDTVEYVGTGAFDGTAYFEAQENWSDNMLFLDHLLLAIDKEYAGVVDVPEGIITIADGAFAHSKLTELTTPDSLKHIGYNAFWDCQNLTKVSIEKSVTTIGRGPFRMCTDLSGILVHEENENFAVVDGVLYNKQLSAVIRCPHKFTGDVVIPHSVTKINAYAFEWCTEIESVDIPEGCVFIGNSAFSVCENLSDVILPESMEYIDQYAFSYCNSIESFEVPDNKFLAWLIPYEGEFETEEELIAILSKINKKVCERICDETGVPPILLFQKEKEYLQSLPSEKVLESYLTHDRQTTVRKDSMVTYMKNRYSVPADYIGKPVRLKVSNEFLQIYYSTDLIATHSLSDKRLNYKKIIILSYSLVI